MDSKSGPRSENGDWTGYFVSGQEAIGYGCGWLVEAAKLRKMAKAGRLDRQLVLSAADTLEEWGNRFMAADEGNSRQFIDNYIKNKL